MSRLHEHYVAAASELHAALEGVVGEHRAILNDRDVEMLRLLGEMVEAFGRWAEAHLNQDATAQQAFDAIQALYGAVYDVHNVVTMAGTGRHRMPLHVAEQLLETIQQIDERRANLGGNSGIWVTVSRVVQAVALWMAEHRHLTAGRWELRWALFRNAQEAVEQLAEALGNEIGGLYWQVRR